MSDESTPETTYKAFFEYDLSLIIIPSWQGLFAKLMGKPSPVINSICIWPYLQRDLPYGPDFKLTMTGYGGRRTIEPAIPPNDVHPNKYFSNAGFAENCKFIALILG